MYSFIWKLWYLSVYYPIALAMKAEAHAIEFSRRSSCNQNRDVYPSEPKSFSSAGVNHTLVNQLRIINLLLELV